MEAERRLRFFMPAREKNEPAFSRPASCKHRTVAAVNRNPPGKKAGGKHRGTLTEESSCVKIHRKNS